MDGRGVGFLSKAFEDVFGQPAFPRFRKVEAATHLPAVIAGGSLPSPRGEGRLHRERRSLARRPQRGCGGMQSCGHWRVPRDVKARNAQTVSRADVPADCGINTVTLRISATSTPKELTFLSTIRGCVGYPFSFQCQSFRQVRSHFLSTLCKTLASAKRRACTGRTAE